MSLQSPQSQENDRLLEICKNVSNEQNAEKLTKLIHQLNESPFGEKTTPGHYRRKPAPRLAGIDHNKLAFSRRPRKWLM